MLFYDFYNNNKAGVMNLYLKKILVALLKIRILVCKPNKCEVYIRQKNKTNRQKLFHKLTQEKSDIFFIFSLCISSCPEDESVCRSL